MFLSRTFPSNGSTSEASNCICPLTCEITYHNFLLTFSARFCYFPKQFYDLLFSFILSSSPPPLVFFFSLLFSFTFNKVFTRRLITNNNIYWEKVAQNSSLVRFFFIDRLCMIYLNFSNFLKKIYWSNECNILYNNCPGREINTQHNLFILTFKATHAD